MTFVTLLLSSFQLNAFTSSTLINSELIQQVDKTIPLFTENANILSALVINNSEYNTAQFITSTPTNTIANNLTLLYSICLALVLFNLVVQVKIIIQIINLFFQFRKKDEFAGISF